MDSIIIMNKLVFILSLLVLISLAAGESDQSTVKITECQDKEFELVLTEEKQDGEILVDISAVDDDSRIGCTSLIKVTAPNGQMIKVEWYSDGRFVHVDGNRECGTWLEIKDKLYGICGTSDDVNDSARDISYTTSGNSADVSMTINMTQWEDGFQYNITLSARKIVTEKEPWSSLSMVDIVVSISCIVLLILMCGFGVWIYLNPPAIKNYKRKYEARQCRRRLIEQAHAQAQARANEEMKLSSNEMDGDGAAAGHDDVNEILADTVKEDAVKVYV